MSFDIHTVSATVHVWRPMLFSCVVVALMAFAGSARSADAEGTRAGQSEIAAVVRPGLGERLDSLLAAYEAYGFAGTVLVTKANETLLHKGYGLADQEAGIENTPNTLFDMGSVTKTVTGAAILHLEASGQLHTSDLLSKHIGPMPGAKARATIHHLATHKAGLVIKDTVIEAADRRGFIEKIKDTPVESPPGESYRYTNVGFSLLAAIVEEKSGKSFETYVGESLFAPLGITAHFAGETRSTAMARGYAGDPAETSVAAPRPAEWGLRGASGWIATVSDVHRWLEGVVEGKILPAAQAARTQDITEREAYGWHWSLDRRNGRPVFDKGGDTRTFQAQVLYYPHDDVAIVWAYNDNRRRWRTLLNEGISRIALEEPNPWSPPEVINTDPQAYSAVSRRYRASDGTAYEVRFKDRYLYLVSDDKTIPHEVMYFPTARNVFTGLASRALSALTLRFEVNREGQVIEVTWSDGTRQVTAR